MNYVLNIAMTILFTLIPISNLAANNTSPDSEWVETTAKISCKKTSQNEYDCTISYSASKSTAIDSEGKPINGQIEQFYILEKKPIKLSYKQLIKYMKNEPVIFETIE